MPSILLNSTNITTEKLMPMVKATTTAMPITKTTTRMIMNLSIGSHGQNKRPTIIIYPTGMCIEVVPDHCLEFYLECRCVCFVVCVCANEWILSNPVVHCDLHPVGRYYSNESQIWCAFIKRSKGTIKNFFETSYSNPNSQQRKPMVFSQ